MGNEDVRLREMLDSSNNIESKQSNTSTENTNTITLFPDFKKTLSKKDLIELIKKRDAAHMSLLGEIIRNHGWPCISVFGEQTSLYSFLIIQHASLEEQLKYFPLIESAARRNEASLESVALMHDRILIRQGKEQLYGTQAHSFNNEKPKLFPISDFKNVNKRRAQMGLPPLEEYIKKNNLLLEQK